MVPKHKKDVPPNPI